MAADDPETIGPPDAPEAPRRRMTGGRDTPPRKQLSGAAKRARAREKATSSRPAGSLKAELEVSYMMMGQLWSMKDPECGGALMDAAPQIAQAWDEWAQTNPAVHRVLSSMTAGTGPLGVIAAHLPLILTVTAHHGPAARAGRQAAGEHGEILVDPETGYDQNGIFRGFPPIDAETVPPFPTGNDGANPYGPAPAAEQVPA